MVAQKQSRDLVVGRARNQRTWVHAMHSSLSVRVRIVGMGKGGVYRTLTLTGNLPDAFVLTGLESWHVSLFLLLSCFTQNSNANFSFRFRKCLFRALVTSLVLTRISSWMRLVISALVPPYHSGVKRLTPGLWAGSLVRGRILTNTTGRVPLVLDQRYPTLITHERWGSTSDPSLNGPTISPLCLQWLVRLDSYTVNLSFFNFCRLIGKLTAFWQLQEFISHNPTPCTITVTRRSPHISSRKWDTSLPRLQSYVLT
jgi:hypothetical protein